MLYLGLLKVSAKHLFGVTSGLLSLLAAGLGAQAAGYLVAAGALPGIIDPLWDTSWLLSQDGVAGRLLSVLVGYQDHPSAMQVMAYAATLGLIITAAKIAERHQAQPKQATTAVGAK